MYNAHLGNPLTYVPREYFPNTIFVPNDAFDSAILNAIFLHCSWIKTIPISCFYSLMLKSIACLPWGAPKLTTKLCWLRVIAGGRFALSLPRSMFNLTVSPHWFSGKCQQIFTSRKGFQIRLR